MDLFSLTVILFLIMDPIGNISSFLSLLQDLPKQKRRKIIIREMLIALIAMILFNILGEYIFWILDINETTVRIASGLILFLVAIKILFPSVDSLRANLPDGEPFITPLAIPLIAGPSLLATIMLFARLEPSPVIMLLAILLAWFASMIVLLLGRRLKNVLGLNGLAACERLMGMILVMLAIQRLAEGLHQFVKTC